MHYDLAEEYYAQATTLAPNNAALWNDYALLRIERGDLPGAEELFAKSLTIDTQYSNTYILRGNFYLQQEQWQEAADSFDQGLAIDPNAIPALSGKAFALARGSGCPKQSKRTWRSCD